MDHAFASKLLEGEKDLFVSQGLAVCTYHAVLVKMEGPFNGQNFYRPLDRESIGFTPDMPERREIRWPQGCRLYHTPQLDENRSDLSVSVKP